MRVLLIHQAFCGPNDPGGTRHYEIALRLAAQGHQLTIVTSRDSYITGRQKDDCVYPDGIRVLFAPALRSLHKSYFQRTLVFLSFAVSSFFVALRSGPHDVVIGTSPPIFQCFPALSVAMLRRQPFVLEVRDLWPEFAIALRVLRNPLLIAAARVLETVLYRFAKVIVVNSPAYVNCLQKRGVPESKIILIANGVDASAFDTSNRGEAFRAEHDLGNSIVVTYTGALGVANGVESLVQAAHHLRYDSDIRFVIVGDGKYKPILQRQAEALRAENILFVPAQPKKRIPQILAAADVCVATLANAALLHLTYPNKVFDYMAAGRPTVLAIKGPMSQAIQTSGAGICVEPENSSAIADAILLLRRSQEVRTEMGGKARAYVEQYFSRTEQARQFAQLLEDVAPVAPCKTQTSRTAGGSLLGSIRKW